MGKLHKFQIVLDNERGVFYPGDIVAGHVIVDLKEEMKIRGNFVHSNLHYSVVLPLMIDYIGHQSVLPLVTDDRKDIL